MRRTASGRSTIRQAAEHPVRVNPKTETFQSWPIPSGAVYAASIRHMRPTRDANLLIHQSSTNRIILVILPPATTQ